MGYVRSGKHGYSTFHLNAFRLGYNERKFETPTGFGPVHAWNMRHIEHNLYLELCLTLDGVCILDFLFTGDSYQAS